MSALSIDDPDSHEKVMRATVLGLVQEAISQEEGRINRSVLLEEREIDEAIKTLDKHLKEPLRSRNRPWIFLLMGGLLIILIGFNGFFAYQMFMHNRQINTLIEQID